MTIPIDDRGLTLGDGLFETVLAENGALVLWGEHVARLVRGCEAIGLPAKFGTLRFSFGRDTTADEVARAGDLLAAAVGDVLR